VKGNLAKEEAKIITDPTHALAFSSVEISSYLNGRIKSKIRRIILSG
jgi:hypothetical protein